MADQMTDAELAAGLPPPEQRPAQRLGIPPALPTPSEGVPTGNTPPGLERLGGMLSMLDALRQKKTITDEEYRLFVKDAIAANIATPALAPRPAVTGQEGQGARFERFLMDEAEHRRKPWKTRRQNVLDRFYAGGETSTEEFRECFESLAERGKLSPYDILVCHYLLYVDDVEMGRMMLLGLLLTTDRSDIVETHNWNMHSLMTATQQEGRGKPIPSLKPLFPPWAQQRLNEEAFAAARGGLQGGDAGPTPAVRGKSYSDLYLLDDQIMEGGAYSEAVYDHNGQQVAAISMNETEARLECILRAIEELKASVQGRGQGTRRQTHLTLAAQQALHVLGLELSENPWWTIAAVRQPTYMDDQYDVIIYTDASAGGWGAIAYHPQTGHTTTYQQRWGHDTHPRSEWRRYNPAVDSSPSGFFTAKHSAHAEPRAAQLIFQQLVREDKLKDGDRVALVTDHEAIVHAQKHLNGFGGIGRGDHINYLYKYTHDLLYNCGIDVTFFYIDGPRKPADSLSRNFGVYDGRDTAVVTRDVQGLGVPTPTLDNTYSPLCENRGIKGQRFPTTLKPTVFSDTHTHTHTQTRDV